MAPPPLPHPDRSDPPEDGTDGSSSSRARETGGSVYELLRQAIIRGHHAPGSRLVEAQLADALGVSRTPIRAALARLEGDGLVETIPHRGAFVTRWTDGDLEEIYALRVRLEPYASKLAAGRIEPSQLERLGELAAAMDRLLEEEPKDWTDRCTELNTELHLTILQASGSARLISMVSGLTELPLVRRAISLHPRPALRRNFAQHHQIIQALRQREGEWAESLMAAHILGARQTLRAAAATAERSAVLPVDAS